MEETQTLLWLLYDAHNECQILKSDITFTMYFFIVLLVDLLLRQHMSFCIVLLVWVYYNQLQDVSELVMKYYNLSKVKNLNMYS